MHTQGFEGFSPRLVYHPQGKNFIEQAPLHLHLRFSIYCVLQSNLVSNYFIEPMSKSCVEFVLTVIIVDWSFV